MNFIGKFSLVIFYRFIIYLADAESFLTLFFIHRIFEDPEILKVSRDDYFVFLTPENQLYDTSVIDA